MATGACSRFVGFRNSIRSLTIAIILPLCAVAGPDSQDRKILPDDLACPVTENLFPEKNQSPGFIRFIFPSRAIPERISMILMHPKNQDVSVEYTWVGNGVWGTYSGVFISNGQGRPNCFFFAKAMIPASVPCREFVLRFPEGISIVQVAFSSLRSERPEVLCPMPELEWQISRAYSDCELNPNDKSKASVLIQLLEKTTPKYDCRGPHPWPVPAWWLASRGASWRWVEYLYRRVLENNDDALRVYEKF
jgi:hypothetical protein